MHRPSAYALVQNQTGELAVVRTPRGCFLPGGGIESGETPEQAVARESQEESGLVIKLRGVRCRGVEFTHSTEERACYEKDSIFFAEDLVEQTHPHESDHQLA